MKLWVLSDLHLEVAPLHYELEVPEADVCVMAGDLTRPLANGVRWLAAHVLPWMPVVYVPGNHEYYRSSLTEGWEAGVAEAAKHPGLYLLNDDVAVLDGVRFLGSTLWTDFKVMGSQPLSMEAARRQMNDYRTINARNDPFRRFTPELSRDMHVASKRFLVDTMSLLFDGPTVVVTHHCPHPLSIHAVYRGDMLNAAFASDLSEEIEAGRPDLWVHGHTHFGFDYRFAETRVLCNPRGYGTENRRFDPTLVVEVPV